MRFRFPCPELGRFCWQLSIQCFQLELKRIHAGGEGLCETFSHSKVLVARSMRCDPHPNTVAVDLQMNIRF